MTDVAALDDPALDDRPRRRSTDRRPTVGPVLDETAARLVQAAADVFAEKGYDKAGVAEIARRAGLTTGAIYSRYTGKAELLAAAIATCVPDEFDELFAEHAFDGRVVDILRSVGAHLVSRPPSPKSSLLLEAFVAARRDPELAAAMREAMIQRRALLADLIDTAKAVGVMDPDVDTLSMVHFAQAVGLGFLAYDTLGVPHPAPADWEALVAKVVGSVVVAPGVGPSTTATP